jgi:hypothetical protein
MILPSMLASAISGILIFIAILLLFTKNKGKQQKLILLFSIAIGIHGIAHLGLEIFYHYPNYLKQHSVIRERTI